MPINYGTSKITGISYGLSPVRKAYYGKDLVWGKRLTSYKGEIKLLASGDKVAVRDDFRNKLYEHGISYKDADEIPYIVNARGCSAPNKIFEGCVNLEQAPKIISLYESHSSTMTYIDELFSGLENLEYIPDFTVEQYTLSYLSIFKLFYGCRKLKNGNVRINVRNNSAKLTSYSYWNEGSGLTEYPMYFANGDRIK